MTLKPLRVAIVGHTNTGKTSLLRTLLRDTGFGEISDRPATTRHVEGAAILIEGEPAIELYDTPGLEDSIGLFEHLDSLRTDRRSEGAPLIEQFLASPLAQGRFAQEAKALRQVLHCDVALYVIDAREHVVGRHRDELTILSWCARPVVPVLNFLAAEGARVEHWREQLARTNLHVVAEFDTVIVDDTSEQRLLEKLRTVLDTHRETINALIEQRKRDRDRLIAASAHAVSELLVDVAGYVTTVSLQDQQSAARVMEGLRNAVRGREQACIEELLELHRFQRSDYDADTLATVDAALGLDLFSPEAMKQFGVLASRGAVVGAAAGLTLDAMTAGISFGAFAAVGATAGAALETLRKHGGRFFRRMQHTTEVRCNPQTVRLLAVRQIALVKALLARGHASQSPARPAADFVSRLRSAASNPLPPVLKRARTKPHWSTLSKQGRFRAGSDQGRAAAVSELAMIIEQRLRTLTNERPAFP